MSATLTSSIKITLSFCLLSTYMETGRQVGLTTCPSTIATSTPLLSVSLNMDVPSFAITAVEDSNCVLPDKKSRDYRQQ